MVLVLANMTGDMQWNPYAINLLYDMETCLEPISPSHLPLVVHVIRLPSSA